MIFINKHGVKFDEKYLEEILIYYFEENVKEIYKINLSGGYAYISHYGKIYFLHRIIAQYYSKLEEIPNKHVVHHIDGDPKNNFIENLQVVSLIRHAKIHGYNDFIRVYLFRTKIGFYYVSFCCKETFKISLKTKCKEEAKILAQKIEKEINYLKGKYYHEELYRRLKNKKIDIMKNIRGEI